MQQEPELVKWLDVPDRKMRQTHTFTPEIEAVVCRHFFNLYTSHFSAPGFSDALACIPQVRERGCGCLGRGGGGEVCVCVCVCAHS